MKNSIDRWLLISIGIVGIVIILLFIERELDTDGGLNPYNQSASAIDAFNFRPNEPSGYTQYQSVTSYSRSSQNGDLSVTEAINNQRQTTTVEHSYTCQDGHCWTNH